MKIALICSDSGSGGLIKYINNFINTATRHHVNLYCGNTLKIDSSQANSLNIIRTNYVNEKGLDLIFNKRLNTKLIHLVEEFSPDIVIFMNGYIRRGLEKFKTISIVHNQLAIRLSLLLRQRRIRLIISMLAVRKAVLYSLCNADGIIFLSEASKKETDKKYRYKNGKVILFGQNNEIKKLNYNNFNNELIYISTGFPYKNHINLIKALLKVKKNGDFHINFVGCNPTKLMNIFIKRYGLSKNVDFYGWVSHCEILNMIRNSNIYVHASLIESTSNGVLEGVLEGNTIVCSEIDVFKEALGDAAYYFDPKDSKSISDMLIRALNKPKKLKSDECERILSKYDYKKSVNGVYEYAEYIYTINK